MPIDLEARVLDQVRDVLRAHVPECEVWVFGSRVTRKAKRFSDLDLAVVSSTALPVRRLALLASAFEESELPIKVDIVDWQSASPSLQAQIADGHEVIFHPQSS
jgi:type I restriction enzyme S subunit